MSSEGDLSDTSSLTSLEDDTADKSGSRLSKRRKISSETLRTFFGWLDQEQLSCSNFMRILCEADGSGHDDDIKAMLRKHARPFASTRCAETALRGSNSFRKAALSTVLEDLESENKKISAIAELRRAPKSSRADDIATFRFAEAGKAIRERLPTIYAITTAMSRADHEPDASTAPEDRPWPGTSALATAFAEFHPKQPRTAFTEAEEDSDSEEVEAKEQTSGPDVQERDHEPAAQEHELAEAWEDDPPDQTRDEADAPPIRPPQRGTRDAKVVSVAAILTMLFGRSRTTSRFQLSLGLFLFASRTSRRVIEILSRLGLSVSYLTLQRTVKDLSRAARARTKAVVEDPDSILTLVYDNINWMSKVRNKGTTHTNHMSAAVHGALLRTTKLVQLRSGAEHPVCHDAVRNEALGADMPAPSVDAKDVVADGIQTWPKLREQRDENRKTPIPLDLHPSELLLGSHDDEHLILATISHVRKAFLTQHSELDFATPPRPPQVWPLAVHKTDIFPLPVLDVDEGTMQGNIEVFRQFFVRHLGISDSFWQTRLLPIIADVFTVEKIKQAQRMRRRERSDQHFDHLKAQQPWPAPWHLMYAYIRTILLNYGTAKGDDVDLSIRRLSERVGMRNLLTPPYNFHDASRFLQLWFAAASCSLVLSALKANEPDAHKSGLADLDEKTFLRVSADAVREALRCDAEELLYEKQAAGKKRDDVALFSRAMFYDIALFIELQSAIGTGDIGRMVVVMKQLVPRFQATGQHNYVAEVLEILFALRYEMPPKLKAIMLSSLLVNPRGEPDCFIPTDLLQENFVFDLKHTWPVGGSFKSLAYKSSIGWLLQVLSNMKMGFWADFGIAAQNQKHSDKKRGLTIKSLQLELDGIGIFDWKDGGRTNDAFEVYRGERLRTKRLEYQAAKKDTKNLKQSSTVATDLYKTGWHTLEGRSGTLAKWLSRKAAAMGQSQRTQSGEDGGGDTEHELDDQEGFQYVGISGVADGVVELEMDD